VDVEHHRVATSVHDVVHAVQRTHRAVSRQVRTGLRAQHSITGDVGIDDMSVNTSVNTSVIESVVPLQMLSCMGRD
jgi:hypothetical protein